MIRRKLNNEKCGCCCTLKEKLQYLWDHTMGAIRKVNDITPDGDGKFIVEAGQNVNITPISNGMRISTTGEVSYYSAGDTYVDVDNDNLRISMKNPGQTGGVALHDDLEQVADYVDNLIHGGNHGSNLKPLKLVNGVLIPVTDDLVSTEGDQIINGEKVFTEEMKIQLNNIVARYSPFFVSTLYNGADLVVSSPNSNNFAGLRIVFNQVNNTVSLEIVKMINGDYSSSTIATL